MKLNTHTFSLFNEKYNKMKSQFKVHTLDDVELKQLPFVPPPKPILNGGLYTGERFEKGAPWANVPVIADVDYMTHVNLRSANPPPQALYQYPGNVRPGNNYQANSGLQQYKGDRGFEGKPYNFSCIPCEATKPMLTECKCKRIAPISGNNPLGTCNCQDVTYLDV